MQVDEIRAPTLKIADSVEITVIAPGVVFLKNAISQEDQIWLASYAMTVGSSNKKYGHSFWETLPNGTEVLNSQAGRGRIFDCIEKFPCHPQINQICNDWVSLCQKHDSKVPSINATHLLLLWYANDEGMFWHSDNDKNDGDNEHPVVSVSLGNTCQFGYKLTGKKEEVMELASGDVLIWGGPNRMLPHCIHKVLMNTCPDFLPIKNVRLNFTFRDAPGILGQEKNFKYNVDLEHKELLTHLLATVAPVDAKSESRGF